MRAMTWRRPPLARNGVLSAEPTARLFQFETDHCHIPAPTVVRQACALQLQRRAGHREQGAARVRVLRVYRVARLGSGFSLEPIPPQL